LGAPHIFNGIRVDLTTLAPNGHDLYLSRVYNKIVVEVDEEGMEAAASSGCAATKWQSTSAIGQAGEEFNCNRPFIFIIHDHLYRLPLVIGKYTRPEPL
jgi:serine protease inhibitor